jgi:hypothetical protein
MNPGLARDVGKDYWVVWRLGQARANDRESHQHLQEEACQLRGDLGEGKLDRNCARASFPLIFGFGSHTRTKHLTQSSLTLAAIGCFKGKIPGLPVVRLGHHHITGIGAFSKFCQLGRKLGE